MHTVLAKGSYHCTDLGFSLFNAEFCSIFKIDILQFFKICLFFKMLSAEQLQMRLPIHSSHQNAVQLLWSASTVNFHCATTDVHGSVTQLTC